MVNSRVIPLDTIIMQAFWHCCVFATVSTVETVKADLFPHREAALTADGPIHSIGLSCRISKSRPIDSSMVATFLFIIVKRCGIIKMFSNNSTIAQMI